MERCFGCGGETEACPACRGKLGNNCAAVAKKIRSDPEFARMIHRRLGLKAKVVFAEIFGHGVLGMDTT